MSKIRSLERNNTSRSLDLHTICRRVIGGMRKKLSSDSSTESGFVSSSSPRWSQHPHLSNKSSLEFCKGTQNSGALARGSTDSLSPVLSPSPFLSSKMSKMKHFELFRWSTSTESRQKSCSEDVDETERITYLSTQDMHLIVETWHRTGQQRLNFAMSIYEQVFSIKPCVKKVYNFRSTTLENLRQLDTFCHQAQAFVNFIDTIVSFVKLNNERGLRDEVISMGELHAKLVTVHIEPSWWAMFLKSMLQAIRPFCYSSGLPRNASQERAKLESTKFRQLKFLKGKLDRQKSESEPELSGENREDPAAIRAWSRLLQNVINTMKESFEGKWKETHGTGEESL